jgi:hypothetical protein
LNAASTALYATQPYQGTDVVAFVFGLIAVLFGALWVRDREPGMGWFGLSMATLSLWLATNALHVPVDPFVSALPWGHVVVLGLVLLAFGLVDYLGVPGPRRRAMLAAMLLPALAYTVLIVIVAATGAQIVRTWANLLVGLSFLAMAGLAFWASRREPAAGHGWVGLALLGIPAMSVAMAVLRVDSAALRYWASWPVLLFALTLFTVSLLRRRRALEAEVARRSAAEAELTRLTPRSSTSSPSAPATCSAWSRRWRASTAASRTTCAVRSAASPAPPGSPTSRCAAATPRWRGRCCR